VLNTIAPTFLIIIIFFYFSVKEKISREKYQYNLAMKYFFLSKGWCYFFICTW